MSSSFNGIDLFGSGPHRFALGKQGELVVQNTAGGIPTGGSTAVAALELDVVVRGRLVASSESGLWSLRDAITAQLQHPPVQATLVDLHGRTWADMSFIRFESEARTDRGRVVSLGYVATFRRFSSGADA